MTSGAPPDFSGARSIADELKTHLLALERKLQKPFRIIDAKRIRGARYASPNHNHYFVLAMAKIVSSLNATIHLLEAGFLYEQGLLIRFQLEQESKLRYVMAGLGHRTIDAVSKKYLGEFFGDNDRSSDARPRYRHVGQTEIHRRVSSAITLALKQNQEMGLSLGLSNDNDEVEKGHSYLYSLYSNYVHGRYPESMDLFDHHDLSLKVSGRVIERDADLESELLELLADSASKAFRSGYLQLMIYDATLMDRGVVAYAMGDEMPGASDFLAERLKSIRPE